MPGRLWAGVVFLCWAVVGFSPVASASEVRGAWQNFGACLLLDLDACEEWWIWEQGAFLKSSHLRQYQENIDNNDYDAALENINAYIDAERKDPKGYYYRGILMGLRHDYSASIDDLSIAIGLAPDIPDLYLTRGFAGKGLGRWQDALDDFDQAIALGVGDGEVYYERAMALDVLGRVEEALDAINLAIEKRPDDPRRHVSLAIIYNSMGQYDNSLSVLDRVHERWSNYAPGYNCRCWTLAKFLGQYAEALPYCERALELDPDDAAALHSRGYVFLELGQKQEAVADFRHAAELGNESDFVRDDLARALALPD